MNETRPYLAPLVTNAASEIDALGGGLVLVSETARAGLADALAQRLEIATSAVIKAMAKHGAIVPLEALLGASWSAIFTAHADLVPLVERIIVDWRDGVRLLLKRLATDAALLGETRAELREVSVVGGAWKCSPTLRCMLGSGRVWFYKNHTLAIGAWLMELVRRLNDVGNIGLHVRTIEACPGYGWDTAVLASECHNTIEVERYFIRIGMWLRLMQVLGANDLHAKNIIAAGEHPIPIDHENLLQPSRGEISSAIGQTRLTRQRSPLECGLLPHLLVAEPGRRAVNAGGLEVGGNYRLPFITPEGYPEIDLPRTLPKLGERIYTAREGTDAILEGYASMHALLAGPGAAILDELLPLTATCEVRVLRRPAHVTRRLMVESLQPAILTQPGARAALLKAKAHPTDLSALLALEVPRQYELAALDFVRRTRSDDEHLRDRAAIATAMACADPRAPRHRDPEAAPQAAPQTASATATAALNAAVALGDRLIARAHSDRNAMHWLGVVAHPLAAAHTVERLPNDLLSGNAGLAVVFAALFKVTREPRFADAARASIAPVAQDLAAKTSGWRPWGAYVGSAGQLYAVQRSASLLGAAVAPPSAAQLAQLLAAPSGGIDLATGTAGLVAVAATVLTPPPWLTSLGDVLLGALQAGLPPLPYPDAAMPAYLPDATSGLRFALRRLALRTNVSRFMVDQDKPLSAWDVAPAEALLHHHAVTQRWLADDLSVAHPTHAALGPAADDLTPSGMFGLGAVVLSLLRAGSPDIPSLWTVD